MIRDFARHMRPQLSVATLAIGLLYTGAAHAQVAGASSAASSSPDAGEIVVTAQRRTERLVDIPISITAVDGAVFARTGSNNINDLTRLSPGVLINSNSGVTQPTIRGIGTNVATYAAESPVATYLDGVYQGSLVGIGTDLPNIESIQILKGPQGTLYGRNATGGAILIKTLDPLFTTEGNIEAGYGRFNEAKAKLYLTAPLSSDLAANVSAYYRRSDGFVRDVRTNDLLTKQHFVNLRSKLLWSPESSTRILLTASYDELSDPSALAMHAINGNTAGNLVANSGPLADRRGFASMNVRPVQEQSGYSAVLDAQTDIGFATLRSISSYRKEKIHIENDLDSSYAQVGSSNFQQRFETYGEQLILNGRAGRFLDWVAGVEYIYNNARAPYYQVSGATPGVPGSSGLKSDAFAAYVDGTAHLGKFSIIGGIRYSDEKKHKVFRRTTSGPWLIDVSKRFKDVTPRLGLQYAIDGRSNVYATWSKGFKSGTFNPTVNDRIPVNPEKATAYEVGFKTSQPTFRLNTSAYYYRYSDIQVSAYDYTTGTSRLINAAKAEIYGADADLTISPTREFDLHVGAAYTHARYSSFPGAIVNTPRPGGRTGNITNIVDASGSVMIRAPAFTASAGMNYRTDLGSGNVEFAVSGFYSSRVNYTFDERLQQDPYATLDGSITWNPNSRLRLTLWGRNLTNTDYAFFMTQTSNRDAVLPAAPRTFGVLANYKF